MKVCSKCGVDKPEEEYYERKRQCKSCVNLRQAAYNRRPDIKEKRDIIYGKAYSKNRRETLKEEAVAYKGGSCVICGYNKYLGSLDFHHIDPSDKTSKSFSGGKSFKSIKDELDKCLLVCSNCHREIHGGLHESYA